MLSASGPIRKAGGGGAAVRFRPDTKSGVCECVWVCVGVCGGGCVWRCAVHFRHNTKGGGVA